MTGSAMRRDPTDTDELLDRLRKIEGQVRGLQHMIERHERCSEVLTQVAAARAALAAVGVGLLDAQLRSILSAAGADAQPAAEDTVASLHLIVR